MHSTHIEIYRYMQTEREREEREKSKCLLVSECISLCLHFVHFLANAVVYVDIYKHDRRKDTYRGSSNDSMQSSSTEHRPYPH